MKEKYSLRKMWVVVSFEGKRFGMIVPNREWTRDPSGQMWVRWKKACVKVLSAKPCIVDWMDDLSCIEKWKDTESARRFTDEML